MYWSLLVLWLSWSSFPSLKLPSFPWLNCWYWGPESVQPRLLSFILLDCVCQHKMLYCALSEDLALAAHGAPVLLHHFSGETETSAGFVGIGTPFLSLWNGLEPGRQCSHGLMWRGQRAEGQMVSLAWCWLGQGHWRQCRAELRTITWQDQAGFALQCCVVCKHVI